MGLKECGTVLDKLEEMFLSKQEFLYDDGIKSGICVVSKKMRYPDGYLEAFEPHLVFYIKSKSKRLENYINTRTINNFLENTKELDRIKG